MPTAYLVDPLEDALKREGLYSLIPPDRHSSALPPPAVLGGWILLLACGAALSVAFTHGPAFFALALVINVGIIGVVAFLVSSALFPGPIFTSQENHLEELEVLIVVLSSLGVASASGLVSGRFSTFAIAIAWSAALVWLISWVRSRPYGVHTTAGAFRLALRMARKSLTLQAVLMPLGLAVVLFALFSQELWQALSHIGMVETLAVGTLIGLPMLLLTLASSGQEAHLALEAANEDEKAPSITDVARQYLQSNGMMGYSQPADIERAGALLTAAGGPCADPHLQAVLRARIKTVFILLLFFSGVVLFVVMTGYLFALCSVLFTPDMITDLARSPAEDAGAAADGARHAAAHISAVQLGSLERHMLVLKVAILLAAFVTSLSSIQALNDKALDEFYQHWLKDDVHRWRALGALYRTLVVETPPVREEVAGEFPRTSLAGDGPAG
jgi:hypothetical protein